MAHATTLGTLSCLLLATCFVGTARQSTTTTSTARQSDELHSAQDELRKTIILRADSSPSPDVIVDGQIQYSTDEYLLRSARSPSSVKSLGIKKTVNRAILLGADYYIPCLMRDPIAWLKGDYIIYMDDVMMYDSSTFGSGKQRERPCMVSKLVMECVCVCVEEKPI